MATPQARESIGRSSGRNAASAILPGHGFVSLFGSGMNFKKTASAWYILSSTHSTVKGKPAVIVVTLPRITGAVSRRRADRPAGPALSGLLLLDLARGVAVLAACVIAWPVTWSFGICCDDR